MEVVCGGVRGGRTVCKGRFRYSITRSYLDYLRDLFIWWSEMSNGGQHSSLVTSEKSIARSAGMYNIRFDLGADRKRDRMKRLRRYNRKHRMRRWLGFGAVPALLFDGAISLPLFIYLQRRKLNSINQRFGVCSIRRNRRLLVEASTHVFEHAGVVCGGVRRAR